MTVTNWRCDNGIAIEVQIRDQGVGLPAPWHI